MNRFARLFTGLPWVGARFRRFEVAGADRGRALGPRGERLAARCLRRKGYRVLERNLHLGRDEADLVALDPDGSTVVIVEVKSRSGLHHEPEEVIDRRKQYRLARFAARLQSREGYAGRRIRFDTVAVVWPPGGEPVVRHAEGAFESPF